MYDLMDRLRDVGWEVGLSRAIHWSDQQDVVARKGEDTLYVKWIPWADGGAFEFNLNGNRKIFKDYVDGFEEITGEKFYKD
jgi:hypothetical protein